MPYVVYVAGNKHTQNFDSFTGNTEKSVIAQAKKKYRKEWKDLCIWVEEEERGYKRTLSIGPS